MNFDIKPGKQTIEFTPMEDGFIPWSRWMGMIDGTFIIKNSRDIILHMIRTIKAASIVIGR